VVDAEGRADPGAGTIYGLDPFVSREASRNNPGFRLFIHLHRSAPSAGTPADREFANPDADCSGLRSGTGTIVRGTARKSVAWMVLTDAASFEVIGTLFR